MLATLLRSLLALALLGTFAQADAAGRRVALVIGHLARALSFDLVASWKIDGPPHVALQAGQRNRLS
jgi:hypothetical protein